ncbi:MAG: hypothetical protein PHR58_01045, partial [Sphaerochaetaceae bacterium]|nr:hypothetical protein [Sphaerochaetaceae bacterium]
MIKETYLSGNGIIGNKLAIITVDHDTTDRDKFLILHEDTVKYRTGDELLSDIGGIGSDSLPLFLRKAGDTV